MAFNGLGTFNRLYNWVTDKANSIKIRADRMDAEMDGFATGLSTCITKDGQTTITANLPMAGFKHTGVGNASARNQYAAAGQIQDQSVVWCSTSGGTANAQTLTPTPAITAYAAGQKFSFLPVATNTSGTVTIANSGLSARNVKKGIGGAKVILAVGDLVIGVPAEVVDDGTDYILLNPQTYTHGADIASAATVDLNAATGDYVYITGTIGITAITLAEGREVTTKFSDIVPITNGASLIAPGNANYTTAANDIIVWRGEASGVVRAIGGLKANGGAFFDSANVSEVSVASASTCNIGAAASTNVLITGTTTITAFDNVAAGINRKVRMNDSLTLTHSGSGTLLLLPGNANITTVANDTFEAYSLGSGNWVLRYYKRASGLPVVNPGATTTQTASSSANITFSSLDFTTNLGYDIFVNNVVPATDGADLRVQLTDDGSVYDSPTTQRGTKVDAGSGTSNANTGFLFDDQDSDDNPPGMLVLRVIQPLTTEDALVTYQGIFKNNAAIRIGVQGAMEFTYTAAVTGIRFVYDTGNITKGTFILKPIAR